jgi:uncharacterized protein (TIGR03086 family)
MTGPHQAALRGGVGLLERAIAYLLGSLHGLDSRQLATPTPCSEWDLRALLAHVDDALLALHEAAWTGSVGLEPSDVDGEVVSSVRKHAGGLLGAWAGPSSPGAVLVAGSPLTAGIVTGTGALELAVHGWDLARARGRDHPIPPGLAGELLELAPLFVTPADRAGRFAAPVTLPAGASRGDRLLAFLGRRP